LDGTVAAWRAARDDVIDPCVHAHSGRLVKFTGDGFLAEFPSVQEAVRCALAMHDGLTSSPLDFRMGVNLGDIVDDGRDIHGEGVNVAARLESLAEPGGICISGEVHAMARNRVQYAYEDLGEHSVKHVTHPVRVVAIRPASSNELTAEPAQAPAQPTAAGTELIEAAAPSIAVLPFANMSQDPEQEYFADGIVEDIITALSRARWLRVIARNSSFTYKGRAVDVKQVGRELDVRYVLEGSVRKAGKRLRIAAQLIDAATGAHLWAERFDGEMEDVFDLQDRVTSSVVGTVAPKLEEVEIERARRKPTESLDAYDHYLRGMAGFHEFSQAANAGALAHFLRATELDPAYAAAYGMAARCYGQRKGFGWLADEAAEGAEAKGLARKAAERGRDDAIALAGAGFALVCFDEVADGASFIERALTLNPNLAWALHMSGFAQVMLGHAELGVTQASDALRLSPQDPQRFAMRLVVALGHFFAGREDEAVSWAKDALRERPNFAAAAGVMAASAACSGRIAEAEKAMATLRQIDPALRVSNLGSWLIFQKPADAARWVDGLRKAGLPE
jgi:TolB-like protein